MSFKKYLSIALTLLVVLATFAGCAAPAAAPASARSVAKNTRTTRGSWSGGGSTGRGPAAQAASTIATARAQKRRAMGDRKSARDEDVGMEEGPFVEATGRQSSRCGAAPGRVNHTPPATPVGDRSPAKGRRGFTIG